MIRFAARRPFLSRRPASLTSTRKRFSVDEARRRVVLAPRSLVPSSPRTGPADAESAYHSLWNRRRPTAHWLPFFPARRITIVQQNRVRGTARLSEVIVHSF